MRQVYARRSDITMDKNDKLRTLMAAGVLCALTGALAAGPGRALPGEAGIVPSPVKMEMGTGAFPLTSKCKILYQKRFTRCQGRRGVPGGHLAQGDAACLCPVQRGKLNSKAWLHTSDNRRGRSLAWARKAIAWT
jgi:hypothetical protein